MVDSELPLAHFTAANETFRFVLEPFAVRVSLTGDQVDAGCGLGRLIASVPLFPAALRERWGVVQSVQAELPQSYGAALLLHPHAHERNDIDHTWRKLEHVSPVTRGIACKQGCIA